MDNKFIYADVNRYDEKDNLIDTLHCTFMELVSYDNFHIHEFRLDYLLNVLEGSLEYLLSSGSKGIVLRSSETSTEYSNFYEMLESIHEPIRDFVKENKDFLLQNKNK